MKRNYGFTLVELMITLAILAILVSFAAPSFNQMMQNNRLTSRTNDVVTALNLARSESIKRGGTVTVTANGGDWNNGWSIADAGGTVIRAFPAPTGGITVSNAISPITFAGMGGASATIFNICDSTRSGETGRQISIAITGRISTNSSFVCG